VLDLFGAMDETQPPSAQEAGRVLTPREVEVVRLMAEGLTDGNHLRSIYEKLGLPSRAAAAREAVKRGLI
jgi:DNA-binding CsgD family transcriptional regulator